jgi:tRNA pseudouridine38-40 synthase
MFYYKTVFQYIGTNYSGFQFQLNCKTVQGEINVALSKIHTHKMTTIAASRTDTGVHAIEQFVKFSLKNLLTTFRSFYIY